MIILDIMPVPVAIRLCLWQCWVLLIRRGLESVAVSLNCSLVIHCTVMKIEDYRMPVIFERAKFREFHEFLQLHGNINSQKLYYSICHVACSCIRNQPLQWSTKLFSAKCTGQLIAKYLLRENIRLYGISCWVLLACLQNYFSCSYCMLEKSGGYIITVPTLLLGTQESGALLLWDGQCQPQVTS